MPFLRLINCSAKFITVNVFSPKKSIFSNPSSSTASFWYCVHNEPSCMVTGISSCVGMSEIIMPQACVPVFLAIPSIIFPSFSILKINGFLCISLRNSADFSIAPSIVIPRSSGTILAILLASSYGMSYTLHRSRIAIFAPKVPKVMIFAT